MPLGVSESLKYVVITPARNEARFIELTLKSVTNQTVLPRKWVIVSDVPELDVRAAGKSYTKVFDS
jgi:hypothetical protein